MATRLQIRAGKKPGSGKPFSKGIVGCNQKTSGLWSLGEKMLHRLKAELKGKHVFARSYHCIFDDRGNIVDVDTFTVRPKRQDKLNSKKG